MVPHIEKKHPTVPLVEENTQWYHTCNVIYVSSIGKYNSLKLDR
jgi:hypothetical protein